jgi:hypothetical protein
MIEFTGESPPSPPSEHRADILLTTTLPVHPLLAADPRLSASLIEDEKIYAETPVVNGDLATGICRVSVTVSVLSRTQAYTGF